MNEFPTQQEVEEREVITDPRVLMQRFFESPRYLDALARFKEGKNPDIAD